MQTGGLSPQGLGPGLLPELHAENRIYCEQGMSRRPTDDPRTVADFEVSQELASSYPSSSPHNAASLQVAWELGMGVVAAELARHHGKHLSRSVPYKWPTIIEPISWSYGLWHMIARGRVREELGITIEQVGRHIDQVLHFATRRLTDGARRKHRNLPLKELLPKFDGLCVRHRSLDIRYHGNAQFFVDDPEGIATEVLSEPVSEEQLARRDNKSRSYGYGYDLPEDYMEFLRISDKIAL